MSRGREDKENLFKIKGKTIINIRQYYLYELLQFNREMPLNL